MTLVPSPDSRTRHTYVIGKSGMGKTTLLLNMMLQDVMNGDGLTVLDPGGDFSEKILARIPRQRVDDTIYFEPTTIPLGIGSLRATDVAERDVMTTNILRIFDLLSGDVKPGPRWDALLRYSVATLLDQPEPTFLDIHRILTNDSFRQSCLKHVKNQNVLDYWRNRYEGIRGLGAADPILDRLSAFMTDEVMERIFSSESFSVRDVMEQRKILIVNLAHAGHRIPILGSILVTLFQVNARKRAATPEKRRIPHYLYLDEFQNFTNPAIAEIMREARKYRLCLTLANQILTDVPPQIFRAVVGNAETIVCFRLGLEDVTYVQRHFDEGRFGKLTDLDPYAAAVRVGNRQSLIRTYPEPHADYDHAQEIIDNSAALVQAQSPKRDIGFGASYDRGHEVLPSPPPPK